MKVLSRIAILFSCSVITLPSISQINTSKYEIGGKAGVFLYQGDLTPSQFGAYESMRPQFGVFVNRILNRAFALRLNLDLGSISGDDSKYGTPAWRRDRNFKFSSPVIELSGQLVWDILGRNENRPAKSLSPYLFAGAGATYLSVHRDFSRLNTDAFNPETGVPAGLVVDQAAAARRVALVVPAGVGLRYALTEKISIIGETSYRFSTTDYMDGFSQAANPAKNDHYYSHSLGVMYSFGKKSSWDCPAKP